MSNQPTILIVDDEPQIRRLLRAALDRAGYRAIEAATGAEALRLLAAESPEVVLLDLGLPDRDGLELIPLMLKQGRATILIVSARDATEEKVAALDLGAADYVTKPFDTNELLARVRAATAARRWSPPGRWRSTWSSGASPATAPKSISPPRNISPSPSWRGFRAASSPTSICSARSGRPSATAMSNICAC
jgi:DNA-binding response OmpR family regulator